MFPITALGISLLAILLTMTIVWLRTRNTEDVSIVDVFWGLGFVIVVGACVILAPTLDARTGLLTVLISLWGLRLAWHLFRRWSAHKEEDLRYAQMRANSKGNFATESLFKVFWLQAIILWIVALPPQLAILNANGAPLGWLDAAGTAIFLIGFAIEVLADRQLRQFKKKPESKNQVLKTGLWAWSRHPNYFGEAVLWWGLFMIACAVDGVVYTFVSPLLMTFLLVRVSGVRMLDGILKDTKPAYADYMESTSSFIPWPPRKT